ncbi:hypothetical protein [Streptomyces murinus]|uniref:hypothetical protein n=1 Tax=Streptomyces murinus TaxID=33900 RepID=UPI003D67AFF0
MRPRVLRRAGQFDGSRVATVSINGRSSGHAPTQVFQHVGGGWKADLGAHTVEVGRVPDRKALKPRGAELVLGAIELKRTGMREAPVVQVGPLPSRCCTSFDSVEHLPNEDALGVGQGVRVDRAARAPSEPTSGTSGQP